MFADIKYLIRIYSRLELLHLRSHLEYEADFWIGIIGMLLTHAARFIFVWALFTRVPVIAGWSLWEVALLYGLSIIPRGLVELLYNGQSALMPLVNQGDLDLILTRPVSPALQVITQLSSVNGFGNIILGLAIVIRALAELHLAWTIWQYGFLVLTVFGGVLLIGSIDFVANCIVFWEPMTNRAFPFLVQSLAEFAKFPLTLYDRFMQSLLTWGLPFAFISYYPGAVLLGKPEVPAYLGYLAPLAGPLTMLAASFVWGRALGRYQGTGH